MKLSNKLLAEALGDDVQDSLCIGLCWNEITFFVGYQRIEKQVNKYELVFKIFRRLKSRGIEIDMTIAAEDLELFFDKAEEFFEEGDKKDDLS